MATENTPPLDVNGTGVNTNEGEGVFDISPNITERNHSSGFLIRKLRVFLSSLLSMSVYFPIFASVAMVLFYISDTTILWPQYPDDQHFVVHVLVVGFLVASIIVIVLSILTSSLATAQGANAEGYNILKSDYNDLIARLHVPNGHPFKVTAQQVKADFGLDRLEIDNIVALRKAYTYYYDASENLSSLNSIQWVLGTGYPTTWEMIHRAQEALIEVEPISIIISEAMRDHLDLLGSSIENRDDLLKQLMLAVEDLDVEVGKYFGDTQLENLGGIQEKIQELSMQIRGVSHENASTNVSPKDTMNIQPVMHDRKAEIRARAALHQVKYVLNRFKENRLIELVQARNNLTSAIFAGGLGTYLLLCITILLTPSHPDNVLGPVETGTIFYIVGAVIGLFGRLYSESMTTHAANDYGLYLRRLIATPLLSGLAALGGVFLVTVASIPTIINTVNASSTPGIPWDKALSVTPFNLLVAAIFGLTPNLLIRSLQQRADMVISDLEGTRSNRLVQEGKN